MSKEATGLVQDFLKSDRQWKAEHRRAHAKYQIALAGKADDKTALSFWRSVFNANKPDAI